MKTIYLASTVISTCYWRRDFVELLEDHTDYKFISPNMIDDPNESVVVMDKNNIRKSDIVVAYILNCTFGTTMEIMYESQFDYGLVYVIDPQKLYLNDIWLRHHTNKIFASIDDCVKRILELDKYHQLNYTH